MGGALLITALTALGVWWLFAQGLRDMPADAPFRRMPELRRLVWALVTCAALTVQALVFSALTWLIAGQVNLLSLGLGVLAASASAWLWLRVNSRLREDVAALQG